jgi:hypothetical protein
MELIYARWLGWCTRAALTVLIVSFAAYALGLLEPLVALQRLPEVWGLPLERFLAATGAPIRWDWLGVALKGDYANLVGIAMLGMVSVVCYLRVLAPLVRTKERALAVLAALQIAVLVAAASGLLSGGH